MTSALGMLRTPYASAVYTYAADLKRIAKETDAVTVKFLWDAENILQEYDDLDATLADYTYDPQPQPQPYGDLISQHRESESSFYHFDAQGSTAALTDASQVTTDEYAHTAFGQQRSSTGTTDNPFTWLGQLGYYKEADTRYTARLREYQAHIGRFLSEDPIDGDPNRYRYVRNSPVNNVDPSGLGWSLWRWLYTGDGQAPDHVYQAAREGAASAYSRNARTAHQALDVVELVPGVGLLGTGTQKALEGLQGPELTRQIDEEDRDRPDHERTPLQRGIKEVTETAPQIAQGVQLPSNCSAASRLGSVCCRVWLNRRWRMSPTNASKTWRRSSS